MIGPQSNRDLRWEARARVPVGPGGPTTADYPVEVTEPPSRMPNRAETEGDSPKFRYAAGLAGEIERSWQQRWVVNGTFNVPNPVGSLAPADGSAVPVDKIFVQDMFP